MYYTYIIRCEDNSLYTGITTNIERRLKEHITRSPECAKYTYTHIAKELEAVWISNNRKDASKLEFYIKKLTKKNKEKLIKTNCLQDILSPKINYELYTRIYNIK